jgi:predicted nucleotidyltransferase
LGTPRGSSPSVEIKSLDGAEVHRAVDGYANWLLSSFPEVEEVVVFGSFEKGTYAPGSDVDILIRISGSGKTVRDRVPGYLPATFPVGMDLFPYTDEELAARADSPLLLEIARSGWRYRLP